MALRIENDNNESGSPNDKQEYPLELVTWENDEPDSHLAETQISQKTEEERTRRIKEKERLIADLGKQSKVPGYGVTNTPIPRNTAYEYWIEEPNSVERYIHGESNEDYTVITRIDPTESDSNNSHRRMATYAGQVIQETYSTLGRLDINIESFMNGVTVYIAEKGKTSQNGDPIQGSLAGVISVSIPDQHGMTQIQQMMHFRDGSNILSKLIETGVIETPMSVAELERTTLLNDIGQPGFTVGSVPSMLLTLNKMILDLRGGRVGDNNKFNQVFSGVSAMMPPHLQSILSRVGINSFREIEGAVLNFNDNQIAELAGNLPFYFFDRSVFDVETGIFKESVNTEGEIDYEMVIRTIKDLRINDEGLQVLHEMTYCRAYYADLGDLAKEVDDLINDKDLMSGRRLRLIKRDLLRRVSGMVSNTMNSALVSANYARYYYHQELKEALPRIAHKFAKARHFIL